MMISVRSTAIGEENQDLVNGFRVLAEVVPEGICILEMGLGITLLGVNEMGELGGISDKEDWSIVLHRYR